METIKFDDAYINDYSSVVGPMEKLGKLKKYDYAMDDYYYNTDTFEQAEVKMQRVVIEKLMNKNSNIDLFIGGDLSNQIAITNYGARNLNIPFLGLYNACATFCEELIISSSMLLNKGINKIMTVISSHNLTAEKQFRFPTEYGSPKKSTSSFTATGAVSTIISNVKSNIRIESGTIGKCIDMGIGDVNNMGAIMAYAAVDTLVRHLSDMNRTCNYYDIILTGDLGKYGSKIFLECLKKEYDICLDNYCDAGTMIYADTQNTYAGASGPVTLPLVLFNKIIPNSKIKRILIIATGSLHSPLMVNQKNTVPAIAHAVSLEVSR